MADIMLRVPKAIPGLYGSYSHVLKNNFLCNELAADTGRCTRNA